MYFLKNLREIYYALIMVGGISAGSLQATLLHDLLLDSESKSWLTAHTLTRIISEHPEIDIDDVHPEFGTAFHIAVDHSSIDLMASLFDSKADIDTKDANDETALFMAIRKYDPARFGVIGLILNMKPDLDIRCHGQTVRELAESQDNADVLALLDRGTVPMDEKPAAAEEENVQFDKDDDTSWAMDASTSDDKAPTKPMLPKLCCGFSFDDVVEALGEEDSEEGNISGLGA